MRLILAMSLLIGVSAAGNPFGAIPTYMASEQLSVNMAKSEARIVGDFVFRRSVAVLTEQNSRVIFQIPIWFPEQNPDDKSVADFWETFQKDTSHVIPTERVKWIRPEVAAARRKTLKRAIDLKVVVGKQEIPVTEFFVFPSNTKQIGIPQAWKESGFCCVMFSFGVEPSLIRDATRVTISYRQPYLRRDSEARLFYVPIFENLPNDVNTADTNRYAITFTTAKECSAVVTTGKQQFAPQAGQSVTLAPTHHQAIRVTTTVYKGDPATVRPATNGERDILQIAKERPLKVTVNGIPARYGDPNLAAAVDALGDIPHPWTVPKIIGIFKMETSAWLRKLQRQIDNKNDHMWEESDRESKRCGDLATLLAASRDPRAAVVLGDAFDNIPEFPGGVRVLEGLYGYFLSDPRYRQLPPEKPEVRVYTNFYPEMRRQVKRWWALNKEALKASTKAQSNR